MSQLRPGDLAASPPAGSLDAFLSSIAQEPAHVRGDIFELACLGVLRSTYSAELRQVWRWKDWPGRWGSDAGIDLVGETYDGDLWAIQAKAYASQHYIKKSDIDSFLSESSRPGFTFRLLIGTTDNIGPTAHAVLAGQAVQASTLLRSELDALQFDWTTALDGQAPLRQRAARRPSSVEAVTAVVSGLANRDRGQLHMACGTGKTLVGLWSAEGLKSQSTLVLLPSLSLLAQTLREWRANGEATVQMIAVCSDPSVTSDEAYRYANGLGIPVTTDAAKVAEFLSTGRAHVVFSTYQSSDVIVSACAESGTRFDLAIADEAHRCAGRNSSRYGLILDADTIPADRRLFMTATPRIFSAKIKKRAAAEDLEIASMDDECVFGPVLHRLTFGDAIERGLLCDYQVVVVGVDDASLARDIDRRTLLLPEGQTELLDAASLASLVAVARSIPRLNLRRLVSFHSRVRSARVFAERLPAIGVWMGEPTLIHASHVSGEMAAGKRLQRLRALGEGTSEKPIVLANARCLSEGIDVPNLDGVVFVDPRESQVDIVQAVGRAIRLADDKRVGTIILPVFLQDYSNASAIEKTAFATVWKVIRALRAHDSTLAEELDEMRQELGRRGGKPRLPSRIVLDLPASVSADLFESLTLQILSGVTSTFANNLGTLQAYVALMGHAAPKHAEMHDGVELGKWVAAMRVQHRQGLLAHTRAHQLESLPGWIWEVRATWWRVGLDAYLDYLSQGGQPSPPLRTIHNGYRLGTWVNLVRKAHRIGTIDPELLGILSSTPGWTWNVLSAGVQPKIDALSQYWAREKNFAIPHQHVEDGVALGMWLSQQRRRFKRGLMAPRLAGDLDAISPTWREGLAPEPKKRRSKEAWLTDYRVLQQSVTDLGVAAYRQNAPRGGWVRMQREAYRASALSQEEVELLERLPEWVWHAHDAEWFRTLEHLKEYQQRTGKTRPTAAGDGEQDRLLVTWCLWQIRRHQEGRMAPARKAALEALPLWSWDYLRNMG